MHWPAVGEVAPWTLVGLMVWVLLDTHIQLRAHHKVEQLNDEVMRYYVNAVLALGLLLWPLVWDVAVGSAAVSGLQRLARQPKLFLGLIWPLVMVLVDMQYVRNRSQDALFFESLHRIGYLQSDANTIITAAFAMGTLITSMHKHSKGEGVRVVMFALLLCVAFVIPTSDVPVTSRAALIIRSGQKVCLNYAIGFVIAGIMLDLL
jgi:hypothetical protein